MVKDEKKDKKNEKKMNKCNDAHTYLSKKLKIEYQFFQTQDKILSKFIIGLP